MNRESRIQQGRLNMAQVWVPVKFARSRRKDETVHH